MSRRRKKKSSVWPKIIIFVVILVLAAVIFGRTGEEKEEETKLLEKYGGADGFNNYIRQIMDDLDAELFEKFGDDNKAKCKYLMEMKSN